MRADPDPVVAGDQVALVAGEVEPDPVGILGGQRVDMLLEVRQRAGREVVALGGLDVERRGTPAGRRVAALRRPRRRPCRPS